MLPPLLKRYLLFGSVLALLFQVPASAQPPPQTRWYVKPTATGAGNGRTWADACTLQYALDAANGTHTPPDDIWVAQGTYNPTVIYPSGTDARRKTFHMPAGVGVYGGFLGTEGPYDRALRNPESNETILDGTLLSDGTYAYHVVYFDAGSPSTTKLSGFTIRNGRADHESDADDSYGGGIFMKSATATGAPALDRLVIHDNTARLGGGELYHGIPVSIAWVANSRFEFNSVTQADTGLGGAALVQYNVQLGLTNCIFYRNSSEGAGGAIAATGDTGTRAWASNCTFHANEAAGNGSGKTGGAAYSPTPIRATPPESAHRRQSARTAAQLCPLRLLLAPTLQ